MSNTLAGWPIWQVMLAEIVVGMHDGRVAEGRRPSRNIAATVAVLPSDLIELARQQNATRALRDEHPTTGPRIVSGVAGSTEPVGYGGSTRRKRQATADHERSRG